MTSDITVSGVKNRIKGNDATNISINDESVNSIGNVISGNYCTNTITIGANCTSNTITGNATEIAIVNNGVTNIFAGNVVY